MMTLLDTALVADIVRSALDIYEITGELPVWPLASGETGTMIGITPSLSSQMPG